MNKLLRKRDILLLSLAGMGDVMQEVKDPLHLMSSAYKNMYGFIPWRYKRSNFLRLVKKNLKTGDIEKVVKNGEVYLRLTSAGRDKVKRDFPITNLTKKWNRRWTLLVFDIEERRRVVRDSLRNKLINIGFGMLQESVWITPMPIGEDTWEFIESIGLGNHVFVMEVLALKLGGPKELARKIWHLDRLEDEYFKIKEEIERVNQLAKEHNDRYNKSQAKSPLYSKDSEDLKGLKVQDKENSGYKTIDYKSSGYLYRLKNRKKLLRRNLLEFIISLPPLPEELLPEVFKDYRTYLKATL